jgi:hypothetical protein
MGHLAHIEAVVARLGNNRSGRQQTNKHQEYALCHA